MRKFRTYQEVETGTGAAMIAQVAAQRARLGDRLARIDRLVAVVSGKGGVGKSAITANVANELARRGLTTGAVDADLNGPSLARMLGVQRRSLEDGPDGVVPPRAASGVLVMSIELLQDDERAPLRWREPATERFVWQSAMETGALREFLSDVMWGDLDYLLVDVPPGTDKVSRLLELVPRPSHVLVVSSPSEMSRAIVHRSVTQLRDAGVESLGLVANMTDYVCPDCGSRHPLFPGDGADRLAVEAGIEIWGRIPFDPRLGDRTDRGQPWVLTEPDSEAGGAIRGIVDRLQRESERVDP